MMRLRITAEMIMSILASDLYIDPSWSLWEIVRNAICAHMKNSKEWVPGVGHVEIYIDKEHPMLPGNTLVILDHGRGFTKDDIERFCHLGPSLEDLKNNPGGGNGGASQKRIGRFAALALNSKCYHGKDPKSGFYVFTRTADFGEVTIIPMIPADIERDQGMMPCRIDPNANELGFLKGIRGSFTAIVIPNSMYSSYEEIRHDLKWRLPRKKDQAFKMVVGGEKLLPPPLASRVNIASPDNSIEIHADRASDTDEDGGIWFADKQSGLRVAKAKFISAALPHPYGVSELVGDIFVPNILSNQDTSRFSLTGRYLRGKDWKRVVKFLHSQSDKLRAILGEDEDSRNSPIKETLSGVSSFFTRVWGKPDVEDFGWDGADAFGRGGKTKPPKDPAEDPDDKIRKKPITRSGDVKTGGEKPPQKHRGSAIKIGDHTFIMAPNGLDARTFAQVEGNKLWVNERGYQLLPPRKEARDEHVMNAILSAVAQSLYPDSVSYALQWVGDRRLELLGKK